MNRILFFLVISLVFLFIDWYVYQAIRTVSRSLSDEAQRIIALAYWGFSALSVGVFLFMQLSPPDYFDRHTRTFLYAGVMIPYFSKVIAVLFIFIDDIARFFRWVVSLFYRPDVREAADDVTRPTMPQTDVISRSDFLMKTALVAGAVPLVSLTWGILSGAHDYRIRRVKLALKNLPSGFEGMRIAQLSDIHSGSFFNKTAVKGGVEMLLSEKPDMVFFTGDLVNNTANEVEDYLPIFRQVKAPLGVYSTLGNHDYGDYVAWPSQQAKQQNLNNLKEAHRLMGWNLLLDENRIFTQNGDKIALIGIENWGAGDRWPKYGNLAKAYAGTEEYPVKLLLSHDPSHWDAQVRTQFSDIDAMFAGHTHGMQFGVEIGDFKWSPSQYVYKQWAGLYRQGEQQLYVNRGFGYLGYPGRVGILPEITIIELVKA
ncbi:metallophosphoesterase [Rudanella paleaurantiibacter]|uniref:Metallophosphoesterase n=1 Tax=Rudanella paleaurantiibacter TaxID=2614655 RepID=A0A7J5TWP0_9BACT|nr:metallophosphoesterase [Rudanella paleaurantiibacter]KAB7729007.1 metallophosphoesterase [Rudanella paleaurantiibacter]